MTPFCEIFVFSFNRGPHLAVVIDSILALAPDFPVTVVDDGSTDPETSAILDRLPVPVVRPRAEGQSRLGGLYANMDWALAAATAEFVLMTQDDTQMVRSPDAADAAAIAAFFAASERHAFVNPVFRLGPGAPRQRAELRPWPPFRGYQGDSGRGDQRESSRRWAKDMAIVHAPRLRAAGWRFGPDERANAARAAGLFAPMLHMADPFLCPMPEVPTSRFGRRTLGVRLAERRAGPSVRRYAPLGPEAAAALHALPVATIPLAEDWLHATDPGVRRPFIHKGVNAWWPARVLNKAEILLRRALR